MTAPDSQSVAGDSTITRLESLADSAISLYGLAYRSLAHAPPSWSFEHDRLLSIVTTLVGVLRRKGALPPEFVTLSAQHGPLLLAYINALKADRAQLDLGLLRDAEPPQLDLSPELASPPDLATGPLGDSSHR